MPADSETVAVIGASSNPDRYSYKAFRALLAHGHEPLLVGVRDKEIEGRPVYASVADLPATPDTVTLYVNPALSSKMADAILASGAKRIIMNPGTENPDLQTAAEAKGIRVQIACTLVLLASGQF